MRSKRALSLDVADPFICDELASRDGYTWTPTSRLGSLIAEAEQRFGPRDTSWTILGVEFSRDNGQPQVWYPGNRRHVAIQLTLHARASPAILVYQLAHEVVHLLAPTGNAGAPAIEEGLATYFALEMARRIEPADPVRTASPLYALAAELARAFLAPDPDIVRRMREARPRFADWTAEFILAHAPHVDADIAHRLAAPLNGDAAILTE